MNYIKNKLSQLVLQPLFQDDPRVPAANASNVTHSLTSVSVWLSFYHLHRTTASSYS